MLIGRDMSEQLRAELERVRPCGSLRWRRGVPTGMVATWCGRTSCTVWSGSTRETFVPSLRTCWGLLDRGERARARRLRRRMISSPQFRFSFEIVDPVDGTVRFLEVEGRRSEDQGRLIGTARDVTMQRRAVDRLREIDVQRGDSSWSECCSRRRRRRGRIARALHDDTVQLMAALQINFDRIQGVLGESRRRPRRSSRRLARRFRHALERTRHLMFELRPQQFDRHGLRTAITALCEQVDLEAGFTTSVEHPEQRFGGVVEELCYRTVREAVVNARKHSGGVACVGAFGAGRRVARGRGHRQRARI